MKKIFYIIFALTIVSTNKSFAQNQMKINTQEVADVFGQVCLLHKDKLGDNLKVEIRKLKVGEVIEIDNQKPTRLLIGDLPSIYSLSFYEDDLTSSNIENWQKKSLKSLNRDQTIYPNNSPKTNELKGYVLTSDTLSRVEAVVSFISESGKIIAVCNSDANGKYSLKLPIGSYFCEIKADNCLPFFDSILVSKEKIVTQKDFLLTRVKIGNQIVLKNVFFEFGKAVLTLESKPQLDALSNFLKENKTIEIELSGHTDNRGSAISNQKLSEQRAKAVLDYLVQTGIAKDRLEAKGYGFTQPIALNSKLDGSDNPNGRQENRRTAFAVLRFRLIQ